jgi:two-component system chemotaxis response regulator CheB
MFSTLTGVGSAAAVEALALGASDYVAKPSAAIAPSAVIEHIRKELIPRIKSLAGPQPTARIAKPRATPRVRRRIDIVAIGASTGGPNALTELLPQLPTDFPVPILIVQHMPVLFTHMLAERLNTLSPLQVGEGTPGKRIEPGYVWIAPGGHHMTVTSQKTSRILALNQEPAENSCRPSVDVMFRSVVEMYGNHVLGLVLTGMGSDGASGAKSIHDAGGEVWVQDQGSSIVWGMPGSVVAAGCADQVYSLDQIGRELLSRAAFGRPPVKLSASLAASARAGS